MEVIRNIFDVHDGDSSWKQEEFVIIGREYLCIKTYKDELGNIFTKDKRYELISVDNLSAIFIANGNYNYFLKTYVKATLFKHFNFEREYVDYVNECRKEKIEGILNV